MIKMLLLAAALTTAPCVPIAEAPAPVVTPAPAPAPAPVPVAAPVTPVAGAPAAIDGAKDCAVITLADGVDYGTLAITNRVHTAPVTINAGKALLKLQFKGSAGWIVNGGVYKGAMGTAASGYGVYVLNSKRLTFNAPVLVDNLRGIVLSKSQDIAIDKADISGGRIDGINIAASQRVTVTNSKCYAFITGDAHPDCIQMWSVAGSTPTADVTLRGNSSLGDLQGFPGFNHVRNGVNDGGVDRIVIDGNAAAGPRPSGVVISDCRDCTVTNNIARTPKGARWMTQVRTTNCLRCTISGNVNGARPPLYDY